MLNSSGNMNFNSMNQQNERRKLSMNYSTHLPRDAQKISHSANNSQMINNAQMNQN